MRTTIQLDDDVASAIHRLRREENLGLSEAVNELIRRGLVGPPRRKSFTQRTHRLGLRVSVENVAETLEILESPDKL